MRDATLADDAVHKRTVSLPNVTLVAATSMAVAETVAAMRQSSRGLKFGQAILFTHEDPKLDAADGIEWRRIKRLKSRADYSRFMIRELAAHIGTEHLLCVQWDGFAIRPEAWSNSFLEYDYIGARWPHFSEHTVGNGGFSLRSKRLLEAASRIEIESHEAEDLAICRRCRPFLEATGIKFATPDVADAFAYERTASNGAEFGFHGIFNFLKLMGSSDFASFLAGVEPGLLGNRDWRDLLLQSLVALDRPVAKQLLRYRFGQVSWTGERSRQNAP